MHLADAFIQSDLQCIQVLLFFFVSVWAAYFYPISIHEEGVAYTTLCIAYLQQ